MRMWSGLLELLDGHMFTSYFFMLAVYTQKHLAHPPPSRQFMIGCQFLTTDAKC